jgi:hypothetical protein
VSNARCWRSVQVDGGLGELVSAIASVPNLRQDITVAVPLEHQLRLDIFTVHAQRDPDRDHMPALGCNREPARSDGIVNAIFQQVNPS